MRRTDRLFELIQILRDGRLHTARDMAERVEVSVRTIWRDMASRDRPPPPDGPWDVESTDQDWDDDEDLGPWRGRQG